MAGLAHAAYGTDGFTIALLDPADRTPLRELIGEAAETVVYLYGACDRRRTWRHLPDTGQKYGDFFRSLFASWARVASAQVTREAERVLAS